jgi:hypothetical protein
MPFEVWKTRMGRFRTEGNIEAARNVYNNGGGVRAFWAGTSAKMVESFTKGGILLFAKEAILDSTDKAGMNKVLGGVVAGECHVLATRWPPRSPTFLDLFHCGSCHSRALRLRKVPVAGSPRSLSWAPAPSWSPPV